MSKIYVIEDELAINRAICLNLEAAGYDVEAAYNGDDVMAALFNGQHFDLALVDVMLPGKNGFELLKPLTGRGIPVIFLTAKSDTESKVTGLSEGAEDYITKPFSLSVLRARVNTQLRRSSSAQKDSVIRIDHFIFDFPHLHFCVGGQDVELSKTEQKLLYLLIENRGQVMSRSVLIDRIWSDGADYVDENALSVTVKRLRDKLKAQDYIKTIYGIGYSWVKV